MLLLDTAFKSPNVKLEYIILPYIENVLTVSSIKVVLLQYKAQNYIILYFVHTPYSFIVNSLLRLVSLAKSSHNGGYNWLPISDSAPCP